MLSIRSVRFTNSPPSFSETGSRIVGSALSPFQRLGASMHLTPICATWFQHLGSLQEPAILAVFLRRQQDTLCRAGRVLREEWPQRVGAGIHDALKRQVPETPAPCSAVGMSRGSVSTMKVALVPVERVDLKSTMSGRGNGRSKK